MSLGYVWRVKEKNLSIPFAEVSYLKRLSFPIQMGQDRKILQ